MTQITAPDQRDLAARLPASACHCLMRTLHKALPKLLTNSPEDIALRDEAAMARVASLCPVNSAEAEVAALHVIHAEHAKACMCELENPAMSLPNMLKCRAQAISMSRQAAGLMATFLRMQAARQKTEAKQETCNRAAWAEHIALNLMAEALSPPPQHLSRPAGEVGSHSEPGEGARPEAKDPKPPAGVSCEIHQEPAPDSPLSEPEFATQSECTGAEAKEPPVARPPSPYRSTEPPTGSMAQEAAPMTHHAPNPAPPVSLQTDALAPAPWPTTT